MSRVHGELLQSNKTPEPESGPVYRTRDSSGNIVYQRGTHPHQTQGGPGHGHVHGHGAGHGHGAEHGHGGVHGHDAGHGNGHGHAQNKRKKLEPKKEPGQPKRKSESPFTTGICELTTLTVVQLAPSTNRSNWSR